VQEVFPEHTTNNSDGEKLVLAENIEGYDQIVLRSVRKEILSEPCVSRFLS
jgi:hypothetical protein